MIAIVCGGNGLFLAVLTVHSFRSFLFSPPIEAMVQQEGPLLTKLTTLPSSTTCLSLDDNNLFFFINFH